MTTMKHDMCLQNFNRKFNLYQNVLTEHDKILNQNFSNIHI